METVTSVRDDHPTPAAGDAGIANRRIARRRRHPINRIPARRALYRQIDRA